MTPKDWPVRPCFVVRILSDAHGFVTLFPTWRVSHKATVAILHGPAKVHISGHFLEFIGTAYSNNGVLGWFLHMILRLLPTHFLVRPGFNEVQG
jgi:hypothetical protein